MDKDGTQAVLGTFDTLARYAGIADWLSLEVNNSFGMQAMKISAEEDPHPYSHTKIGEDTYVRRVLSPQFFGDHWKGHTPMENPGFASGVERIVESFAHSVSLDQSSRLVAGRGRHSKAEALYGAWQIQSSSNLPPMDNYFVAMMTADNPGSTEFYVLEGDLDVFFSEDILGRLPRKDEDGERGRILTTVSPEPLAHVSFAHFGRVLAGAKSRNLIRDFTYDQS